MSAATCRLRLGSAGWVIFVSTALLGVQPASGDIGVWSANPTSGRPGEPVELLIGCGGCVPGPPDRPSRYPGTARLPVSLLPFERSPYRRACRGGSCAFAAPSPPTRPPYLPLGRAVALGAGKRTASRLGIRPPGSVRRAGADAVRDWLASTNRLRFRIPDAEPGLYAYVIYCASCRRGGAGTLIQDPPFSAREQGEFLRILPRGAAGARSGDAGGGLPWPIVAGGFAALALIALVIL
jgi:hypothetical protein